MITTDERNERELRAARLRKARTDAGFAGPKPVAEKLRISINTYKAHEAGRNDFGTADARGYARLFEVSLAWLYLGIGDPANLKAPGKIKRLREIFIELADAHEDIQNKVISYAEFELGREEKSRETATIPASS